MLLDAHLHSQPATAVSLFSWAATHTALSSEAQQMHHVILAFLNGPDKKLCIILAFNSQDKNDSLSSKRSQEILRKGFSCHLV